MPHSNKATSTFGTVALELDANFSELERLASEIEHASLDTDKGLERSTYLLQKFAECGQLVTKSVIELSTALEESRARAENSARAVAMRAALIQKRHEENERMLAKFRALSEKVRKVIAAIPNLKKGADGELSQDERSLLTSQLPEIDRQMGELIDDAADMRSEARELNMRELERNADSLTQSLQSARRKLQGAPPVLPLAPSVN